jgi:hypothetical protein
MNAARETTTAISHGFTAGRGVGSGRGRISVVMAMASSTSVPEKSGESENDTGRDIHRKWMQKQIGNKNKICYRELVPESKGE